MKFDFKDFNTLYMLGALNAVLLTLSILFINNPNRYFSPHIFLFIYAGYGFFLLFIDKVNTKNFTFKDFAYLLLMTRLGVILLRVVLFFSGTYFNVVNDVNLYKIWTQLLFGLPSELPFLPPWFDHRFGPPPGTIFWFTIQYILYMGHIETLFWNETIISVVYMAIDLCTLYFIMLLAHHARVSKRQQPLERDQPGQEDASANMKLGMLFFATSFFNIFFFNVKNYYDGVPTLLGIIGLYLYYQKRDVASSIFLGLSAITKIYAGAWLFIILLEKLRAKDWRALLKYMLPAALVCLALFQLEFFIFDLDPVGGFFIFLDSVYEMTLYFTGGIRLNQSVFFLLYETPAYVILPLIVIAITTAAVLVGKKAVTLDTFMLVTSLIIVIMPWLEQRYVLWLLPLACAGLLGSKKKFKILMILLYLSLYLYIFFEQFIWVYGDFPYTFLIDEDPSGLGLIYRIFAHGLLYVFFFTIIVGELRAQFGHFFTRGGLFLEKNA